MKRKLTIWIIVLLCPFLKVAGGNVERDSLTSEREAPAYLMPAIGGSLVVAGSLLDFDHGGRALGMDFKPSFDCKADEVLRFVPAMALVGMKALGVESRTERWGELIVRSAASTAIMGLTVESTKRLVGRVRPDGSDDRSFPSGHSSAAFLTASLFAKEYGHLSPWYSVGAYGVATSTAMLRRMGDHHWLSDVMTGAGIGILSVELGYALADLYYHKGGQGGGMSEGIAEHPATKGGVYMSYTMPHAINGPRVRSRLGYSTGMEASHFFTPNIGIGGRMGITSSQMETRTNDGRWVTCATPLDHASIVVGPHLSLAMPARFLMGVHLHGGYGWYPRTEATLSDTELLTLGDRSGWGYEGGISVGYLTRQGVTLSLMADYRWWSEPARGVDNQGLAIGLSAGWGF